MNERSEPPGPDQMSLNMENQLLVLEVRHLRARLATQEGGGSDAHQARAAQALAEMRKELDALRESHDVVLSDMRGLLRRLQGSLAGPLLRRKAGFRLLLTRYLEAPSE